MARYPMHIERITTVKMSILPKVLYRFIAITLTNQMAFFTGLGKKIPSHKKKTKTFQISPKTQIKTKVLGLTMYYRARDEAQLVEHAFDAQALHPNQNNIKSKQN